MCADLSPDDFVVRYGRDTCTPQALRQTAEAHYRKKHDGFGVSVNVGEGKSPDEIAAFGQRPNSQYRYGKVDEIWNAGCEISDAVDDYGHTNVFLPNPPDEDDYILLSECFHGLGTNPRPTPFHKRTKP